MTIASEPPAGAPPQSPARARGVVLVLDDDPVIGQLLRTVLDRAGFEPVSPADAAAAYVLVEARGDAVVAAICDLQLGQSNGVEVLAVLRRSLPDLRAIVISGHPEAHVRSELARVDADAIVFQKPFRFSDLVAALGPPS